MYIKILYYYFREVRMLEFMKTFSNSDDLYSVNSSASNNYSEDTAAVC